MKQGVIEAYQEDQLVVDLANLDVVRDALHERAIGVADEEPSEQLGLALLTLADVADSCREAARGRQRNGGPDYRSEAVRRRA